VLTKFGNRRGCCMALILINLTFGRVMEGGGRRSIMISICRWNMVEPKRDNLPGVDALMCWRAVVEGLRLAMQLEDSEVLSLNHIRFGYVLSMGMVGPLMGL
jgi:hypothetical protein